MVLTASQFEPFIASVFSKRGLLAPTTEYARFFQALTDGRGRLALLTEPVLTLSAPVGPAVEFANKLRERFAGFSVLDVTPMLADLRQVKTTYEQDVLRKSVQISSEAHRAGMRATAR
jgi:Xaa-Pro aminopeptidase